MKVTYKNDYMDGVMFFYYSIPRSSFYQIFFTIIIIFLGIGSMIIVSIVETSILVKIFVAIIFVLLVMLGTFLLSILFGTISLLLTKWFNIEYSVEFLDTGVITTAPMGKSELKWELFDKVRLANKRIYLFIHQFSAIIIPLKYFENEQEGHEFFMFASQRIKGKK